MAGRLSNAVLHDLPRDILVPGYERTLVAPGIVHLGVGAFHRAHQAAYIERCLAARDLRWGIVGASLQSPGTRDALVAQDGLFTLAERSNEGDRLSVLGPLLRLVVAPEDPAALLAAMADPRTRIVTLTVTEKAYLRNPAGDLDLLHPDILADLGSPGAPRTLHGFLAEAIARRRAAGTAPFTVLSCDNLPANGSTLKRLLVSFAQARSRGLADFIAAEVPCPSSMVDRIVPATAPADKRRINEALGVEDAWPVMTEPFRQWVIEEQFANGRPDWEPFGVTMVPDVRPFEEMKLRLLNGAHSAIAYLGLLRGYDTVAAAFADPAIRAFVDALWTDAATTLPKSAGLDPRTYTGELAKRFANTALAHRTAQIANDGSQKLPQRVIAPALERLEAGASAERLALVVAAFIHAALSRGRTLPSGHFTDPLDRALATLPNGMPASAASDAVFDLAGFAHGSRHRAILSRLVASRLTDLRAMDVGAVLASL